MSQSRGNLWTDGRTDRWTDGQTLIYRTLPAETGGPKKALQISPVPIQTRFSAFCIKIASHNFHKRGQSPRAGCCRMLLLPKLGTGVCVCVCVCVLAFHPFIFHSSGSRVPDLCSECKIDKVD